jgi:AcrR family transcriptional regulator
MGYRHSRDEILAAAARAALRDGIARLTFSSVGRELGISDRMVVYYFPTKADLVGAVARELGGNLMALLEQAFGSGRQEVPALLTRAWPVLASPEGERVFALFFEVIGLASADQEPYVSIARAMSELWVAWLTERVVGGSDEVRRRRALTIVAQLDGLLLVRRLLGPAAADEAAREAGVIA